MSVFVAVNRNFIGGFSKCCKAMSRQTQTRWQFETPPQSGFAKSFFRYIYSLMSIFGFEFRGYRGYEAFGETSNPESSISW